MDENLLQHQLFRQGYSLHYDPRILVWHHAHAERLSQGWFLRRFYWEGRSEAVFDSIVATAVSPPWAIRVRNATLKVWRRCRDCPALLSRAPVDTAAGFVAKCRFYEQAGYLHGLLLQPRSAGRGAPR